MRHMVAVFALLITLPVLMLAADDKKLVKKLVAPKNFTGFDSGAQFFSDIPTRSECVFIGSVEFTFPVSGRGVQPDEGQAMRAFAKEIAKFANPSRPLTVKMWAGNDRAERKIRKIYVQAFEAFQPQASARMISIGPLKPRGIASLGIFNPGAEPGFVANTVLVEMQHIR